MTWHHVRQCLPYHSMCCIFVDSLLSSNSVLFTINYCTIRCYMYAHKHIYICVYIYRYLYMFFACLCLYTHIYIHIIHLYVYIYIHIHTCNVCILQIFGYSSTYMYARMCVCRYLCILHAWRQLPSQLARQSDRYVWNLTILYLTHPYSTTLCQRITVQDLSL